MLTELKLLPHSAEEAKWRRRCDLCSFIYSCFNGLVQHQRVLNCIQLFVKLLFSFEVRFCEANMSKWVTLWLGPNCCFLSPLKWWIFTCCLCMKSDFVFGAPDHSLYITLAVLKRFLVVNCILYLFHVKRFCIFYFYAL